MATTKSNISTSQTLKVGATTITAHTITAVPVTGVHGFHDCTDPSQIALANCVWPTDYVNGAGHKSVDPTNLAQSAVGVTVAKGLTINMRDQSGNVSVTFS